MDSPPIIIVGGGIAGLAAALALGNRDTLILERAPMFSEVGAGLQLGPNAIRALGKLGALDAVLPVTSTPPEIQIRDGISGHLLKRMPLLQAFEKRFGAPYRVAHRADVHSALLGLVEQCKTVELRTNFQLHDIVATPSAITITHGSGNLNVQAVIGADGVNSKIRQSLFPGSTAIDSGEVFHRSLLTLADIPGVAMDCVNLWMFPKGHVVHYPLAARDQLNLVAVTPRGCEPDEFFKSATDPLRQLLAGLKSEQQPWPGLYAPALPKWTKHGALLLGDAAHAALPYLAQGAAMALEDAACLATVLSTNANLPDAFAETARLRRARATRLQHESLKAGRIYHLSGPARLARNLVLAATPQAVFNSRLAWLYKE